MRYAQFWAVHEIWQLCARDRAHDHLSNHFKAIAISGTGNEYKLAHIKNHVLGYAQRISDMIDISHKSISCSQFKILCLTQVSIK